MSILLYSFFLNNFNNLLMKLFKKKYYLFTRIFTDINYIYIY